MQRTPVFRIVDGQLFSMTDKIDKNAQGKSTMTTQLKRWQAKESRVLYERKAALRENGLPAPEEEWIPNLFPEVSNHALAFMSEKGDQSILHVFRGGKVKDYPQKEKMALDALSDAEAILARASDRQGDEKKAEAVEAVNLDTEAAVTREDSAFHVYRKRPLPNQAGMSVGITGKFTLAMLALDKEQGPAARKSALKADSVYPLADGRIAVIDLRQPRKDKAMELTISQVKLSP